MDQLSKLDALLLGALGPSALDPVKKSKQLRAKAEQLQKDAHNMLNHIPAGQPYNSTRDRNNRERSYEKAMKALDLIKQAEELEKAGK